MRSSLRVLLLSLACSAALAAQAQAPAGSRLDIPAGPLASALNALSRQSGAQFVYQPEQLRGLRTDGLKGDYSPDQARWSPA